MSGSYIGGNLSDIGDASSRLNAAGTAATGAGERAKAVSEEVNREVDAVTRTLVQHFESLAGELRGSITEAKNRLGSTDWKGNARAVADSAEATLNGHVDKTLITAQEEVESLKAQLLEMVNRFQSDVSGQFHTVLVEINESYGQLAQGLTTYVQNLENVDANSIKVS